MLRRELWAHAGHIGRAHTPGADRLRPDIGRAATAVSTAVVALEGLPGIRQDEGITLSGASIVAVNTDAAPRVSTTTGRTIAEVDLTLSGTPVSDTCESASGTTQLTPGAWIAQTRPRRRSCTPLVSLMSEAPSRCISRHTAATLTCTLVTGTEPPLR